MRVERRGRRPRAARDLPAGVRTSRHRGRADLGDERLQRDQRGRSPRRTAGCSPNCSATSGASTASSSRTGARSRIASRRSRRAGPRDARHRRRGHGRYPRRRPRRPARSGGRGAQLSSGSRASPSALPLSRRAREHLRRRGAPRTRAACGRGIRSFCCATRTTRCRCAAGQRVAVLGALADRPAVPGRRQLDTSTRRAWTSHSTNSAARSALTPCLRARLRARRKRREGAAAARPPPPPRHAEVAVVFVGLHEKDQSEGFDRDAPSTCPPSTSR